MQPTLHEHYHTLERIGRGGAGVVYRVEEIDGGRIVAMKVLPRTAQGSSLRDEFLALIQLRHDNIVPVFDYGLTAGGDDFFTMEYIEGPPLAQSFKTVPSPEFYRVISGIIGGLAWVHQRGLVHADIKPSNILVSQKLLDEQSPAAARLADFGLAAATRDPGSARARGTFRYAAPEVYAGQMDPRSDLYSLGVVLYELLAGVRPWADEAPTSVLLSQRRGPPTDPRRHRGDIPAPLAELIVSLLEPTPGARIQTADELLARICEISDTPVDIARTPPSVDIGATLHGRERDLAALQTMWSEASRGRGGVALIVGEPGIGKSRLLAELTLRAQLAGGRVIQAAVGHSSLLHAAPRGDRLDHSARFARPEAVANAVINAAGSAPLLLIIDDVETAAADTIECLAYLARTVSAAPVLVCMAASTNGGQDAIETLAQAVSHAERGDSFELAPLGRSSFRAIVANAMDEDVATAIGDRVYQACGGNPAGASRIIQAMVTRGDIAREAGRWSVPDPNVPLPTDDARRLVAARVRALDPAVTRDIQELSVLGSSFDAQLAGELLDDPTRALAALARAAGARLVTADVTAGIFGFPESPQRELEAMLDDARREAAHRRALELLERRSMSDDGISPDPLARHALAINDRERGRRWGLRAARHAAKNFDHRRALAWFERILPLVSGTLEADVRAEIGETYALLGEATKACENLRAAVAGESGPIEQRLRRECRLGELQRRCGDSTGAVETLMAALEGARHNQLPGPQIAAHLAIGRVLWYRADYRAALEHAVTGGLLASAQNDNRAIADLLRLRGMIETSHGDTAQAIEHLDTALFHAEKVGDELLVARVLHEIGRAAIHAGAFPRAVEVLERAAEVNERAARIERVARTLNNLGAAYYYQGDWSRARDKWSRFRRLCERIDERSELVNALNNLGSLYRDMGHLSEAEQVLARGQQVAEETGHRHMAAMLLGNRGEVCARQGDFGAAAAYYSEALAEFEDMDARSDIIETRRRQCELAVATGRINDALDRVVDIARDAKDAGTTLEEGVLHRVAATALRLNGDLESATWFADQARAIFEKLGARYELAKLHAERGELADALGDTARAHSLLGRAVEELEELGARWDLSRARTRLRLLPLTEERSDRSGNLLLELAHAATRLELDAVLKTALGKVLEATNFDRGFILLLDSTGRPQERIREVRSGSHEFEGTDAQFSGSIVRRVASTGEAVSISDIDADDDLREQQSVVTLGLRQIMCAPMTTHGRVIGIVYADNDRRLVDDADANLSLLEAFAAQTAVVVENNRLRSETRRKTELMAILAHEIRNPLAGILGFSDLGRQANDIDDKQRQLFERIRRDGLRLRRLVDNVLELTRHEAGKVDDQMNEVDLPRIIKDVLDSFGPAATDKELVLSVDTESIAGPGVGDEDRLAQVISNLIGNAVKFTPDRGTITVIARTESVAQDDPEAPPAPPSDPEAWAPVAPTETRRRDYVRIDVTDSGPGMSQELCSRLFEKFSQGGGRARGKGVGLGLYISREIVKQHSGSLWVTSEPGAGSTFSLRIPSA